MIVVKNKFSTNNLFVIVASVMGKGLDCDEVITVMLCEGLTRDGSEDQWLLVKMHCALPIQQ